jgi:3D (Asp-Asp-Asp) domain-containing protein
VGRTVAVDPNVIQLGTKIYIPELNTIFTAEDVGGKILGNRIDIFMKTHQQALNFGRKKLTIYLLELPIQI